MVLASGQVKLFPSLAFELFGPKCRIVGNEVKLVLAIFIPTSGFAPLSGQYHAL